MAVLERIRRRRATARDDDTDAGRDQDLATYEERRYGERGRRGGALAYSRAAARERFGGLNWGAAFFGWLVAVGLGVILTALLAAAGAAVGIANEDAETVGIVGAIGLFAIALISYFAGGYVGGRMSRFDGARQGLGVWIWALIIVIVLAIAGAIAGTEYNVFGQLDLPRIPIDEGTLTVGGAITLAAIAIGTLVAAILGGLAGETYHRRVDRAAIAGREPAPRGGRFRRDRTPDRDYEAARST